MKIELLKKEFSEITADLAIEFLTKETLEDHGDASVLKQAGFKADQDQICTLHEKGMIFCGIEKYGTDHLRSASAVVSKAISGFGYKNAKVQQYYLKNTAPIIEGFLLGSYSYQNYKSEPKKSEFETLFLSSDNFNGEEITFNELRTAADNAVITANATNYTRDLVNTTPQDMNPEIMAQAAQELADKNGLDCEVFDEKRLEEEKMNAILSVGRASVHKPRMIHLSYLPENPKTKITLVGKGLTYDSGGLSLKPSTSMVTMKMDKAGACAVLGILKAVSELKLPVEVHGFIGAAENMVDGSAYKPDDVLTARNGKTIEVRNTDAEGRLVLADVLSYAQDTVDADYLFDYATLTGACMVALGPYTTGMMGHSNHLKHKFQKAINGSGELVGSLPFNDHLKKLIKSEIADVCNIASKPYGGAITAALFLDHFITDEMKSRWLHFDIAGPAYTESPWDVNPHGGTGAGVRMSVNFIRSLAENS
ncbi:MAG: leucyl aminopeptidase [Helicobacteraceae bacterium 4484_230]|nr:MAG: leucyl aminopeptidase [Helicobacteraceae bacterium 4484_230]